MKQQLIFTNNTAEAIDSMVGRLMPSSLVVITDDNVDRLVLPQLQEVSKTLAGAYVIKCRPGDENKNLDALSTVWTELERAGATRSSLVLNIGGGMITDMGGFAAATFKRGVRFINVPTTLLAAVDASVGGKTGINFNGYKNEVGAFAESEVAIIATVYFKTLPHTELLSGYAEMLKHALLQSREAFASLLDFDIDNSTASGERMLALLQTSVEIKRRIVETDLHEHGLRRSLNLGHTVGHAFESYAMRRKSPVPHGYAVAWGMVVELVISHLMLGFPTELLHSYADFVRTRYGAFDITCDDYPALLELMAHDKKNRTPDMINFSLLRDCGDVVIDSTVSADNIKAALDIYRDLMGI